MLALNSDDEFRLAHLFGFFCSVKNPTGHFYTEMKYLSFYCKSWKVAVPGHLGDMSKGFTKEISIFLLIWPYRMFWFFFFFSISKLCVGRLESSHWRMVTCHASWETWYQSASLRACVIGTHVSRPSRCLQSGGLQGLSHAFAAAPFSLKQLTH